MPSPFPDHVYVGYWAREKGDEVVYEPFAVKAGSFKKAKHKVETDVMVEFSTEIPGVKAVFYLQREPHSLDALSNVDAFFRRPSTEDVHVGDIVPTGSGGSRVALAPTKATKPKAVKEKSFLGYCLVNGNEIPLTIPATGYMKAREIVLQLAGALVGEHGKHSLSFYLRNQVIAEGEKPEDLLRVPGKSECLIHSSPTPNGKPKVVYPNELNPRFKPHQSTNDERVFVGKQLDQLAKIIKSGVTAQISKGRDPGKRGT